MREQKSGVIINTGSITLLKKELKVPDPAHHIPRPSCSGM